MPQRLTRNSDECNFTNLERVELGIFRTLSLLISDLGYLELAVGLFQSVSPFCHDTAKQDSPAILHILQVVTAPHEVLMLTDHLHRNILSYWRKTQTRQHRFCKAIGIVLKTSHTA